MRHPAALGLIALLMAISAGTQRAQAGLRFCNQANFKFSVAVGFIDREKGWVGKGWTVIEGGECKDAITTRLDNRYYYFFAVGRGPDQALVRYTGETSFCIQQKKFLLYQADYGKDTEEECSKAGLQSEKFLKTDVNGKPDFTINLRGGDTPQQQGASARPTPKPAPPTPNRPPAAPSVEPKTPGSDSACKRYPNLC